MTLLCKNNALYVKACVIQNGVADAHDDVLSATDIKKIFTSFNNQDSFEIYHDEIPVTEVSLLENYISTTDEIIAGTTVPSGSWNVVIRVDNPSIKSQLLNNDFRGISLNNRVQTKCSTGLEGRITYAQLRDAECVIPIYISFVDEPANKVGLHIMSYDVYIQKSKSSKRGNMSLIEDLKALIQRAEEDESSADATIEKDAPTDSEEKKEDEEPVEETTETEEKEEEADVVEEETVEAEEEEEDDEEEPVIKKEEESSEETSEEVTIEKDATEEETVEEEVVENEEVDPEEEEIDVVEEIKKLRAEVDELKAIINKEDENPVDEEVNPADVSDEPIITKSAKIEVTTEETDAIDDFYARTGRDRITGKKIRKESRILN